MTTPILQLAHEAIEEDAKATKGPWQWEISLKGRSVRLSGGVPRFDLTVMDFVRYGMDAGAPRFREDRDGLNIMRRCDDHAQIVPGREHHAAWFRTLDHPDAAFICNSRSREPALAREVVRLTEENERMRKQLESEPAPGCPEAVVTDAKGLAAFMSALRPQPKDSDDEC